LIAIAIITGFNSDLNLTVTAAGRGAVGQTFIAVYCIAIVATFSGLDHAVATTRRLAIGTLVGRVFVAVVAAFARPKDAVAAAVGFTGIAAGIVIDLVAIVAGFIALIALAQTTANHAVATAGEGTRAQTAIVIGIVTVVTGLKGGRAFRTVDADDAITTDRDQTRGKTTIGVHIVGIITGLIALSSWVQVRP